jgi:pimeloyl-ACP methyl ester carboxylesterase
MFAAAAAELRGAEILAHSWTRPDEPPHLDPADRVGWVDPEASQVLDRAGAESSGVKPLLIAKSLGTAAAVQAAQRSLPAIWITPPLDNLELVAALRAATAPFLLVGGTADRMWDGHLARALSPHVVEIEGADHGLYVPGRLAASTEALGRMVTAVEDFLDQAIWPRSSGS